MASLEEGGDGLVRAQCVPLDDHGENCAMQLGGAGTGSIIALCGDGALRQWQVSNHVCSRAYVPYGFLALCGHKAEGGEPVARVLQTSPVEASRPA